VGTQGGVIQSLKGGEGQGGVGDKGWCKAKGGLGQRVVWVQSLVWDKGCVGHNVVLEQKVV